MWIPYVFTITTEYVLTGRKLEFHFESQFYEDDKDDALFVTAKLAIEILKVWKYDFLLVPSETDLLASPEGGRYREGEWYIHWGVEYGHQVELTEKPIIVVKRRRRRVNEIEAHIYDHDYDVYRPATPTEIPSPLKVYVPLRWYYIDIDTLLDYFMGVISIDELFERA
ncbi:MAG: hypothetical protein QW253_00045 [Metallosphaera sp.]